MKISLAALIVTLFSAGVMAEPVGFAFTYQGQLTQAGSLADGQFDFEFELFDVDSGGIAVTDPLLLEDVQVSDGVFTVSLDFGMDVFGGEQLWLDIAVREGASTGGYVGLLPRQPLTASPFALRALMVKENAVTGAEIADGTIGGDDLAADSIGEREIADNQVQRRVTGSCPIGEYLVGINQDGSVACQSLISTIVIEKQTVPDGASETFTFAGNVIGEIGDGGQIEVERTPGPYVVSEAMLPQDWVVSDIACDDGNSTVDVEAGTAYIQLDFSEIVTCVFTNTDLAVSTIAIEMQTTPDGADQSFRFSGDLSGQVMDGGQIAASELLAGQYSVTETVPWSWDLASIECNDANSTGDVPSATATFGVEYDEDVNCVFNNTNLGGTVSRLGSSVTSTADVIISGDNLPLVSFRNFTLNALRVASCNDAACTGGDESIATVVSNPDFPGRTSEMVLGSDNFPVIAHEQFGQDFFNTIQIQVVKCNDLVCAGGDESIEVVASVFVRFPDIAIGTDTFPIISYWDLATDKLVVLKCNDVACSGGDETVTVLDDFQGLHAMAMGTDGLPVMVYGKSSQTWVAKCNDAACAGNDETITTVDTDATFGTSIAIGSDGFPRLAYSAGNALKFIECNDAACSGGDETITELDSSPFGIGIITWRGSLALRAGDLPVIAYFEDLADDSITMGRLKVVACNDSACSGDDETITYIMDPQDGTGSTVSMTIGADGFPLIVYLDDSDQLNIVHCSTVDCSQ